MQHEQQCLDAFVALHGSRLKNMPPPTQRTAFLTRHHATGVPLDAPLVPYTGARICDEFDPDSVLVRFLLKQLATYDEHAERVIGLIFGDEHEPSVLAHVVRVGSPKRHDPDDDE